MDLWRLNSVKSAIFLWRESYYINIMESITDQCFGRTKALDSIWLFRIHFIYFVCLMYIYWYIYISIHLYLIYIYIYFFSFINAIWKKYIYIHIFIFIIFDIYIYIYYTWTTQSLPHGSLGAMRSEASKRLEATSGLDRTNGYVGIQCRNGDISAMFSPPNKPTYNAPDS